jgi:hypothetical protein
MRFVVGQRIEVKCGGDWWNAEILGIDQKKVFIHYVGGKSHVHVFISKASANTLSLTYGLVLLQG